MKFSELFKIHWVRNNVTLFDMASSMLFTELFSLIINFQNRVPYQANKVKELETISSEDSTSKVTFIVRRLTQDFK